VRQAEFSKWRDLPERLPTRALQQTAPAESGNNEDRLLKSLWFKQAFVADILSGAKRDTIRVPSERLPKIGEMCRLQVGPRPAFAYARIIAIEIITLALLPQWRRDQVIACYPNPPQKLARLEFRVVSEVDQQASEATSAP
jgi:uncharacterized protein YqfB (UPF0267 family)